MFPHKETGKISSLCAVYMQDIMSLNYRSFSIPIMHGRDPPTYQPTKQVAYDSLSYPAQIQARLAELQDFVHTNMAQATGNQK